MKCVLISLIKNSNVGTRDDKATVLHSTSLECLLDVLAGRSCWQKMENAHQPFPVSNLRPSRAKRPSSHQVAECGRREEEEDGHGLPQHTEQRQQLAEEEGIKPPKAHTLPHDS